MPGLSAGRAKIEKLSADQVWLAPAALSGQLSTAISYMQSGGMGSLVVSNQDGSVSSSVPISAILSGAAESQPIKSVAVSPDGACIVFQLRSGGGTSYDPNYSSDLGNPVSAVNGLYRFAGGLTVLTAENRTPSVAVDWPALYAGFAENRESVFAAPALSAISVSAFGGMISGAVLDQVSAASISAGGYDVGDTLCSLVSGLSAANDKIRRTLSTHVASFDLEYGSPSALSDILPELSDIEWEDGDVLVVRKQVYDSGAGERGQLSGPFQHTAYVYAGPEANPDWHAMDGTYSADSVVFGEDITLAGAYTSVGNIKISDGVLSAKGKTVRQLFDQIFDKTIQPEPGRAPSFTNFSLTFDNGDLEVGKRGWVRYRLTYNSGTYLQPWDG